MQLTKEQAPAEIGAFDFEVFSTGRRGRCTSSKFSLRCDAVALHGDEVLLLSIIGGAIAVAVYLMIGLAAHRNRGPSAAVLDYLVLLPRALPG